MYREARAASYISDTCINMSLFYYVKDIHEYKIWSTARENLAMAFVVLIMII